MPAPTPIQIRYGPAGLLAQAVAQAGFNQNNQSQADRDFQFINSQMASRDRMAQEYAQQNQSANQLQRAYAMHTSQQPATGDFYGGGVDNGSLLKQTYLQSAANDIPDDEKENLTTLAKARNISPDQFRQAVADAAKRHAQTADATDETASKAAYVKSIMPNLPPEAQAGIASLAADKKTTAAQLRVAGDAVIQRTALNNRVQASQELSSVAQQIAEKKQHMAVLSKALAADGVDVNAAPAKLNPTYSPNDDPHAIKRTDYAGGMVVAPGQLEKSFPTMKAYIQAKNEHDALVAKREAIARSIGAPAAPAETPAASPANGGSMSISNESRWPVASDTGAGVTIGQGQPAAKQITPEVAAQFLQQAQGNKDVARQMASQQGYSF